MNKVLVELYVPIIEEHYNVWLPLGKKIGNVILLLVKAVREMSGGYYKPDKMPLLYDKLAAVPYDVNLLIGETTIRNGTEIVLI